MGVSKKHTGVEVGKSIARNMSVMLSAQVVTWVASFVLLYFLPRYLGSEDFGRLYLALSIKMIIGLMIDFGGNYLIPKEVARSKENGERILSSYLILRVVLWVLSIGLIMLLSDLLGYSEHVYILIIILAIAKLWEGGATAFSSFFQGIEQMKYPSIGNIVERLFVALFAVIALLFGTDSIGVAIIMTAGAFLNLLVLIWFSRGRVKITYRFDREVFTLLHSGMPYFLFSLFSVIYYRIDAVMLTSLTTEEVTGWYGGAFRFFDIVMVLPLIYTTVVFPIFSKLWDDKEGVLENTVSQSLRLMIILGIPATFLIYAFASPIVQFFMGLEEFGPSVIILQIFALSIGIIYMDLILGSALMGAANRQKAWATTGLIAIFINIAANYFLIPYTQEMYGNGGIGAALATLFTELFVMGSAFYLLPKGYLQDFKSSFVMKPFVAALGMLVVVFLFNTMGLYWILNLLFSGIAYLVCLFLFKTFEDDELKILKGYVKISQEKLSIYLNNISK